MEEKNRPTSGERGLQILRGQQSRFEQADRADGAAGLRFNHLHPQVWRDPSCRDDRAQTFPHLENVPCTDVLLRARRSRRRNNRRQRWDYRHRIGWALLLLASLSLPGCKGRERASLERHYTEARLQFQRGYTDQAQKAADDGDHGSANYFDLNWKFRVLRAEIHTRRGNPKQALDLLTQEPPATIADEVHWRRRLVQAFALCQLHDYPAANQRLNDAQQLSAERADRKAELVYFRGRCEVTKENFQEAEKYFQQVLQAAAVDDFVRAWSSANLGLCAKRVQRFEDAIEWYLKAESAFA